MIELRKDSSGVSPTNGLAILFIMTLLLSTFTMISILGTELAPADRETPTDFTYQYSDEAVVIQYNKGKPLQSEKVSVSSTANTKEVKSNWDDELVTVNDRIVLEKKTGDWRGDTIRITRIDRETGRSTLLSESKSP